MSTIWLSADLHLSHAKVANLRGFRDVEQHNEAIMRNLTRHVQPGDTLWLLGDLAMGGWKESITLLHTLPFDVHVVLGNHDRPHPSMSSAHNHLAEFTDLGGFKTVQTMATLNYGGETFLLSHYPYQGDHGPDRDLKFRLRDEGSTLLHGHTHSSEKVSFTDQGTKQIHVGLDAWGLHPVRLADAVRAI